MKKGLLTVLILVLVAAFAASALYLGAYFNHTAALAVIVSADIYLATRREIGV